MSLIELRGLHKSYQRGETLVPALRGVDLTIEKGELVAVCGPSGCGKTTLANLIGLLDRGTSGHVIFEDQDLARLTDSQRSRLRNQTMGFVFQRFNLLPVLSALENVALPLEIQGRSAAESRQRAESRLRDLGLEQLAAARPATLSGGEQQKVALARALVTDPAIVVADEPTANLDTDATISIIDLIGQIHRQQGATVVLFTHDERLIESAERKIRLCDGVVVEDVAR